MPMPPAGDRSLARTAVQLVGKYIHVGARRRIIATRAPRDLTPRGTIPYRGGHLGYAVLSYTWHYTYDQTTTFNTQFVITHSLQTHYIKANIGRSKQTNQTCKFRVSKHLIGLVNSY